MMNKTRNNTHYDGKIAGLYDLGDTLGRGHFAVVKLAKHVFTGEQVAVKVIDKTKLDDVSRAHLFQEVRCMKLVQHPNVVRLYDVIDTQTKLYLILELGDGGDMYDYIIKHDNGVDEETAKKYFRQIVHAISYCHKLHVVHRDLKPENVVFFEKLGMVKLTDFGFSNKFCPGQKLETSCGSLAYSAPEILLGDSYDAPKVDVWSLGVILYMLVCGHAPFQEANDSETLTMIMDCKYTIPQHMSPECCRLIGEMLIRDPEKRATLEQIANDPWLNSGDAIQPADYLPLVSREHLSDEDHAHIIQKMVNGNIAAKEEIVEALDKNEYNHITATYFLLAERKLRAQRQERAQMINSRISRADLSPIAVTPSVSSAVPSPAQEKPITSVEGLVSPCMLSKPLETRNFGTHLFPPTSPLVAEAYSATPSIPLQRKCSIVREEDDNSSITSPNMSPTKSSSQASQIQAEKIILSPKQTDYSEPEISVKINTLRPVFSLPVTNSVNTLSPLKIRTSALHTKQSLPNSGLPSQKLKMQQAHNWRLHSVQSSPQLPLNEINEEKEEMEHIFRHGTPKKKLYITKMQAHSSVISHVMLKMMEHHHKLGKSRTGSSSSLDKKVENSEKNKIDSKNQEATAVCDSSSNISAITKSNECHNSPIKQFLDLKRSRSNSPSNESGSRKCDDFKNSPFTHSVFSADSTDSLDFLSENQPRLTNSMSCGDLAADTSHFTLEDKPVVHSDSISLTEIPQVVSADGESVGDENLQNNTSEKSSNCVYPISNSLSLNSGLSTLQRQKKNLKDNIHSSQPATKTSDKQSRNHSLGFGRLVPSSSRSANKLDINQNGWRKTESRRRNASGSEKNGGTEQAVVDMKLASKCCTLC